MMTSVWRFAPSCSERVPREQTHSTIRRASAVTAGCADRAGSRDSRQESGHGCCGRQARAATWEVFACLDQQTVDDFGALRDDFDSREIPFLKFSPLTA